jgi:hypothetical protein
MYYSSLDEMKRSSEVADQIAADCGNLDKMQLYVEYEDACECEEDFFLKEDDENLFKELHSKYYPIWENGFRQSYLNGNGSYSDWLQDCLESCYSA